MPRYLIALCLAACLGSAEAEKTGALAEFSGALERLAATVAPAVVQVQVSAWCASASASGEDATALTSCRVVGSGVIVDPAGYIITNEHVVRNARQIRIMLRPKMDHAAYSPAPPANQPALDAVIMSSNRDPVGKRELLDAVVLGTSREADLALLKIEAASNLPAIPLQAKERGPRQGQVVLAVGSPEGLDNTMTIGIVSAVGRQPLPDFPMLYVQTDAAINPGNSGGPLLNVEGELIGINTFIINQNGRNQGLGFAVPAAVVRYVYEQLRTRGVVQYCLVGVRVQTVTPTLAQGLNLSRGYGVVISDVLPRSPADSAGLRQRDIITAIDGAEISALPLYTAMMYLHDPAVPVAVSVLRGNQMLEFQVSAVPTNDQEDATTSFDPIESLIPELGILGKSVTISLGIRTGLRSNTGVYVVATTAGNQTSSATLAPGDVIISLNGQQILSLPELRDAVHGLTGSKSAVFEIERHEQFLYIERELEKQRREPSITDSGSTPRQEQ